MFYQRYSSSTMLARLVKVRVLCLMVDFFFLSPGDLGVLDEAFV